MGIIQSIIENTYNLYSTVVLSLITGIATGNILSIIFYVMFFYIVCVNIFFYLFMYTTYFKNFKRRFPISSKTIEAVFRYNSKLTILLFPPKKIA